MLIQMTLEDMRDMMRITYTFVLSTAHIGTVPAGSEMVPAGSGMVRLLWHTKSSK